MITCSLLLRLVTSWRTKLSAVLTELLSVFHSTWTSLPPICIRVLSFSHPTIYIYFSSVEEMQVTFCGVLFSPTSWQCWKQAACYVSACYCCDAPGCSLHTRSCRWSAEAFAYHKKKKREMCSFSLPTAVFFFFHLWCSFLKPDWRKWERERRKEREEESVHFSCPRSGSNLVEAKGMAEYIHFSWRCYTLTLR